MNATTPAPSGTFSGHPKGLYLLFFTEMWERFCYYGMRALLALYVAAAFTNGDPKAAGLKYGAFTALVYATGIFGGAIADKLLGYQRAIICGGLLIAGGEFCLLMPSEEGFLFGLALMVVGNGLFKPNISTIVGKLYRQGDPKRDQGFTIFYMGINLGALIAPLCCESIRTAFNEGGSLDGFRYAFAVAGGGMLLGLVTFMLGKHRLGEHGLPPAGKEGLATSVVVMAGSLVVAVGCYFLLSQAAILEYILYALLAGAVIKILMEAAKHGIEQKQRLYALLVLLFANITFWAIFEQAGNSFTFFAENQVDRSVFGLFEFKTGWFQSVNSAMIVIFAPVFVALWAFLDRTGKNPSIPGKFGWALLFAGAGFFALVLSTKFAYPMAGTPEAAAKMNVGFYWLFITYLLHTFGELCLSPVGLSMVTKLAPPPMVGFTMGAWFMSISIGNFLAGKISASIGSEGKTAEQMTLTDYNSVFSPLGWVMLGIGVLVLAISPKVNRWMHGVK
ncbi:MAG: peptide MFS transporter [Planctomycetes bacterium]|nr:peptide MFS transporter [Planctomycetota bacterium]